MSLAEMVRVKVAPPRWEPPVGDWEPWLRTYARSYCGHPFAAHHRRIWDWVWALEPDVRPDPLVGIIGRGGAKSTTAEMACVAIGARRVRRYGWYVCETQDQADDHLNNVAALLESKEIADGYPALSDRQVGKFGNPKGWRVSRLRTKAGFTIDAVGLDTATRGRKLEADRPDFMVIDDIDDALDTAAATQKKIRTLTRAILPAGSSDLAVLAIQNLVHPDSVFARMVPGHDTPADFLANRHVIGPVPAVADLSYEQRDGRFVITGGTATWAGQDLATCQANMDDWGLSAFLAEAQHDVEPPPGGIWNHIEWARWTDEVPWHQVVRTVVWVDPAVTNKDSSDSQGLQCDALLNDGRILRLVSKEWRTSPLEAIKTAIRTAWAWRAEAVGIETDQGGDTWESVYREAYRALELEYLQAGEQLPPLPGYRYAKAGEGHGPKVHRSQQMLVDYERNLVLHTPGVQLLERALRRFPKTKPFDLADAAYWSWLDLRFPDEVHDQTLEYYDPVAISPY